MAKANLGKNDIFIAITPEELKRFNTIIDDMVKVSGASYKKVVRNMARDVTRAALKNTATAPNKRRLDQVKSGLFWIKTKHKYTGESVVFPGTLEQAEKYSVSYKKHKDNGEYLGGGYYKVTKRGFMKAAWIAALGKLGVNVSNSVGNAERFGYADAKGSNENFLIKIKNAIPFVFEFDKGRNRWKTSQRIVERSIRGMIPKYTAALKKAFERGQLKKGAFKDL